MLIGEHGVLQKNLELIGRGAIYDRKSGRFIYERYQNTPVVIEKH